MFKQNYSIHSYLKIKKKTHTDKQKNTDKATVKKNIKILPYKFIY